jgi:single-stranded-DNA-specific exonuclease
MDLYKKVSIMLAHLNKESGGQSFGDSLRGLLWQVAEVDERAVLSIVQKLGVSEILATILYNRDIKTAGEADLFLSPKLKSYMPNPFALLDMEKAASRIADAVINKEKIAVFGDYDVDGATSTALLKRFFRDLGLDAEIYIPNRVLEGYGPSAEAFQKLKDNGNTLVITVDCGTVSFEPIEYARSIGLDIIILDHHLSLDSLPNANAVVNPNRFDETFEYKYLAAVGVAFFTTIAVRSKLRDAGYFKDKEEVNLMKYLDLVALGTVCDVMNLKGINRAFVAQGLKLINNRNNVGLAVLGDVAKLDSAVQSYHLGFIIGPRINAGGRVGEGLLGSQLLSTEDPNEALEISLKLERLNDERRSIEAITLEEAINKIESNGLHNKPIIMVSGENWHQGILGIIASRLKEKYGKPSAVISLVDGIGKGSARSITGIDMGTLLANAKISGLLLQGGGHAMAGGFSVEQPKLEKFYEVICEQLKNTDDIVERAKRVKIDAVLNLSAVNGDLVKAVSGAAPFGSGNPQPKFAITKVVIVDVRIVGKTHIMFIVADKKTDSKIATTVKCIMFKALETDIGNFLLKGIGKTVSVVGTIQVHHLDDSRADFIVEDVAIST